ncbi:tail fiber [Stenotrophomonas phage Sonora]|nr:tail fiber [Stenotrophomonas phage Sonora]
MSMLMQIPPVKLELGVAGYFIFEKFKSDANGDEIPGTRERLAEFKNLITNTGLNAIFTSETTANQYFGYSCAIGSGNNPPAVTNTDLQSYLIYVADDTSGNSGKPSALQTSGYAPDNTYVWRRWCFRFADGLAAFNNIQEVGIYARGRAGSPQRPNVLCSRALILDSGGNPTSISILPDETLDIYYEFRFYPPADVTGTITLNGVDYPYNIRPIDFNNDTWNAWGYGTSTASGLRGIRNDLQGGSYWAGNTSSAAFYASANQTLYPKEQRADSVWGATYGAAVATRSTYVTDSFTRTITIPMSLTECNVPGGVGSLFYSTGIGAYKITFTGAKVPKTASFKWTQAFVFTIARR